MLLEFSDSPVVSQVLARLRDRRTQPADFRKNLERLGFLLAHEYSKRLPVKTAEVVTPLGVARYAELAKDLVVVGVLRAALPMVNGVMDALSGAKLGLVSARRLEQGSGGGREFEIEVDLARVPDVRNKIVLLVDPMLATGSTLLKILELVREGQPDGVAVLCAIASTYGVERLARIDGLDVVTAAVDDTLNADGYILPGLGDAGDRAFNTD
ncbi:MAG: uracil phosphoribosyltransferase [Promethearchaeota archaeon]